MEKTFINIQLGLLILITNKKKSFLLKRKRKRLCFYFFFFSYKTQPEKKTASYIYHISLSQYQTFNNSIEELLIEDKFNFCRILIGID